MSGELPEEVTPAFFHKEIMEDFYNHYDWGWTITFNDRPIGIIVAIDNGVFKHVVDVGWFSWATVRNILEGSLYFLANIRAEHVLTVHSPRNNIKWFLRFAQYGMLSRVGTIHGATDESLALFQTYNRVSRYDGTRNRQSVKKRN